MALLDRQPPPAPLPAHLPEVPDIRVSTVTPSSAALLRAVGAWRPLAAASAPFSNMQASDGAADAAASAAAAFLSLPSLPRLQLLAAACHALTE